MTLKLLGRIDQTLDIEESFHRNYKIKWLIETDDVRDGPTRVMNCPGVPTVGSPWIFGNDNDSLAYCWPQWTVSQFNSSSHEPNSLWVLEQPFSTRFDLIGMKKEDIENPFAAPPDLSGTFAKYQEEKRFDYLGKVIRTISHEIRRGEQVKFDANRPSVSIGMNYPSLGLNVFAFMIDNVNESPMWGLAARCVKLSNIRWTRNVYRFGYFYTRSYDFEVDYKTFDRELPQEGTKEIKPGLDITNPKNWEVRKDKQGNIIPGVMPYKTNGQDWDFVDETLLAKQTVRYYPQTNFFVLGIPASF